MASIYFLILVFLFGVYTCLGLECYTGFAIIRGKTVGSETKICEKSSDMCYKANADMNTMIKLKLAGCSTWRCMLSSNGCTMHTIGGQSIELCCCKGDLCNAPESNTESIIKGLITHFTGGGDDNSKENTPTRTRNEDDSLRNRDEDRNRGSDEEPKGRNRGSDDENGGTEVHLDDDRRDRNRGSEENSGRSSGGGGGSTSLLSKIFG